MVHVNAVEFAWVLVCALGVALTTSALNDARADRDLAKELVVAPSLQLAASTIVVGERFRLILQLILLGVAVPGLFADRETTLNPVVAGLMSVPIILVLWSWLDARTRKRMAALVTAEALQVKTDDMAELKTMLAHNTEVSSEAVVEARRAYHEANDVNQKIATQGAALVAQGEDRAAAAAELEATVERTQDMVSDLHEGSAPAPEGTS